MRCLVVIAGPEKSGKMPLARQLMKGDPDLVLVHRDFLRTSFESKVDEAHITLLMADLVRGILRLNRSPIVVAWNLEQSDRELWTSIAGEEKAWLKWFDTREEDVKKMIPSIDETPKSADLWYGKPVKDCTHKELLDIIEYLKPFYVDQFKSENIRAMSLGKVEMWKRGERTV